VPVPSTTTKSVTVIEYRAPQGTPVECASMGEAEALRAARGGTIRTYAKKVTVKAKYEVRDAAGAILDTYDTVTAAGVMVKHNPGATVHLIPAE
jgi:hypothetical protein